MKQIILHIPHSSTIIPFYDGFIVNNDIIKNEILIQTDWYTDDIFNCRNELIIKADFSRIFCDPERFDDDQQEEMSKYGMGVLYSTTDSGKAMRIITKELREKIISDFYIKHHQKLTKIVSDQLKENSKALIIDCHSFPEEPLLRDLNKRPNRPDFNIGTDSFHTPKNLVDFSINFFSNQGYSIAVDWPYTGTIVPLTYLQRDKRVYSIMLEINRKLYLNRSSNEKSGNYNKIKSIVSEYIEEIKNYL